MNELTPIIDQVRTFIEHSVPADVLQQTVALSILVLIAGVGLSVFGAKMAKPALTAALGLAGAAAGVAVARLSGYPDMPGPLIGAAAGAVMFGIIGALTLRIWVGVITALVFTGIALGAFGYERIVPHVVDFDTTVALASEPSSNPSQFYVPSPELQQAYRDRTPRQWADEFWAFAVGRDSKLEANSFLVGFGALALGMFTGVVAVRWMLILSTSVIGTTLVASAVLSLIAHAVPDSYQTFAGHTGIVGMGVGAFLVTSLVLQTLLTRKAPPADEQKAGGKF